MSTKKFNDPSVSIYNSQFPRPQNILQNPLDGEVFRSFRYRQYNILDFGAKVDGKILVNATTTNGNNVINSAGAGFASGDVGKKIDVFNGTTWFVATISTVASATQITINQSSTFTSGGALVYYGTDDTASVQAAAQACTDGGGGEVVNPIGICMIYGPRITNIYGGANPNCQIVIPQITNVENGGMATAIRFRGEIPGCLFNSGLIDVYNSKQTSGAVYKSGISGGITTTPAVFGAVGHVGAFGAHNSTDVYFSDLEIRTAYDGSMGGINMGLTINTPYFENLSVNTTLTGFVSEDSTAFNVFGIMAGSTNGGTFYTFNNTLVAGFRRGYYLGEHSTVLNAQAMACGSGFFLQGGSHHAMNLVRLGVYWCKYAIEMQQNDDANPFNNYANVVVSLLDMEWKVEGKWFDSSKMIYDPGNYLRGTVNFHNVVSYFGTNQETPVNSGAKKVKCRSIDAAMVKALTPVSNVFTLNAFTNEAATLAVGADSTLAIINAVPGDRGEFMVTKSGAYALTMTGAKIEGGTANIILAVDSPLINSVSWYYDGTSFYFSVKSF